MEKRIARPRAGRNMLAALLAGLLAVCLTGALTLHGGQKAQAVDVLNDTFSITAKVDTKNNANAPEDINFSLYKVAAALPMDGYDAFTLKATEPYQAILGTQIDSLNGAQADSVSTDDLILMAQAAARVTATADELGVTTAPVGEAAEGLAAGMYLMVITQKGADISANTQRGLEESQNGWVSHAYGNTMRYTFDPQLITVPTKVTVDDSIPTTATPGDWMSDVQVFLKYSEDVRTGELQIVKNLDELQQIQGTTTSHTFVFQIEGTREGQVVFSDVASITIKEGTTGSATIKNIPVDVDITVTEVYSGSSYKPNGNDVIQWPIRVTPTDGPAAGNDPTTVTFANAYDGTGNRGGAAINSFQKGEGESGWTWNKDTEVA